MQPSQMFSEGVKSQRNFGKIVRFVRMFISYDYNNMS